MSSRDKYKRQDKSFSPKEKHRSRRSSSPDHFPAPRPKHKRPLHKSSRHSSDRSSYETIRSKIDKRDYRSDSRESSKRDILRNYKTKERSRSPQYRVQTKKTSKSRESSPIVTGPLSVINIVPQDHLFDRKPSSSRPSRHHDYKLSQPVSDKVTLHRSRSDSSDSPESGLVPEEELDEVAENSSSSSSSSEGEEEREDDEAMDAEENKDTIFYSELDDYDRERMEEPQQNEEEEEKHPLIPKKSRFESSPSASSASSDSVPGGRVIQHRSRHEDMNDESYQDGNDSQYSERSGSTRDAESQSEASQESEEEVVQPVVEPKSPPKPSKPYYYPAIQGCRSVEEFQHLNRIEEGTYGVVYRAYDKKCNEVVALKRLKMEKEKNGFPITSLREISTLMKAQHKNVVTVREVVVGSNMDKIYLVMDYVEHDLKALMETMKQPFLIGEIKCLMHQLLEAVHHLHDNWILHRDLKTSNLLLSHKGILKVGDFGLAREYGSPLKNYTDIVVTLWYRAPELLLGAKPYTCPIDLWSVGCIFGELLLMKPLFPGKGETDQLNLIFKDLGTPTEKIWPGVSKLPGMKKCAFADYAYNQLSKRFGTLLTKSGFDFLNRFLTYNPDKRITAQDALKHPYFDEKPLAISPDMFPTWPAKSEGDTQKRKQNSPRPPSGRKDLEDTDGGGFHMSGASHGVSKSGVGFHLRF